MIKSLKDECELFTINRDIIKKNFVWELSSFYPLCAMLYTKAKKKADAKEIRACKEIISHHVGWFSEFTGMTYLVLAAKLALEEEPKQKFEEITHIHQLLKKTFWNSPYLPLIAYTLSNEVHGGEYEEIILRAKDIYQKMKNEPDILSSKEDIGFSILFSLSNKSDEEIIEEMKACYKILRKKFVSAIAVHALSLALVLGEQNCDVKCDKVIRLYSKLREKGCKYGTGIELASLGLLALVTSDIDEAVGQILEVNIYLLSSKGLGAFGIGKAQRLMYAALLVAHNSKDSYIQNLEEITLDTGAISIMIAEQVALAAAIVSASGTVIESH